APTTAGAAVAPHDLASPRRSAFAAGVAAHGETTLPGSQGVTPTWTTQQLRTLMSGARPGAYPATQAALPSALAPITNKGRGPRTRRLLPERLHGPAVPRLLQRRLWRPRRPDRLDALRRLR